MFESDFDQFRLMSILVEKIDETDLKRFDPLGGQDDLYILTRETVHSQEQYFEQYHCWKRSIQSR